MEDEINKILNEFVKNMVYSDATAEKCKKLAILELSVLIEKKAGENWQEGFKQGSEIALKTVDELLNERYKISIS